MDFDKISKLLNSIDNTYSQKIDEVFNDIMSYIKTSNNEDEIYYNLLNFTGLNIPSVAKTTIITNLFNSSEKLREICFKKSKIEIKQSLESVFGNIDEDMVTRLRDSILGKDFISNGYSNESWDDAIEILGELNRKKIESLDPSQIIFWSKIGNHSSLNTNFLTIENSMIGENMYFMDLVFNNWSFDLIDSPKLEEFWKKLSVKFTENTLETYKEKGLDFINFYCEYDENMDLFGDIFIETELPILIKNNISKMIIHILDKNNEEIKVVEVDLTQINNLDNIENISSSILKKYLQDEVSKNMEVMEK